MIFVQKPYVFSKYGGTVIRGRRTGVNTEVKPIMLVTIVRIAVIFIKNLLFDAKNSIIHSFAKRIHCSFASSYFCKI